MKLSRENTKPPVISDFILEKKRLGLSSSREWLDGSDHLVQKFIEINFHPADADDIMEMFWEEPKMAKMWIKDFFKNNDEKLKEIDNEFSRGKSKIGVITGGRGSGKTVFGMTMGERQKDERPIWFVGDDPLDNKGKRLLPDYIKQCDDPLAVPRGALAIMDEAGIQVNARQFYHKGNLNLTKLLTTLRHDDISILFMTQHTALIDVNLVRLADCMFYKKQSTFQLATERRSNIKTYRTQLIRALMPTRKEETLFVGGMKVMKFHHGLPSFWSNQLSKSWKNMGERLQKQEAEKIAQQQKKIKDEGVMIVD